MFMAGVLKNTQISEDEGMETTYCAVIIMTITPTAKR